ncbi:hypothetical protein QBC34DRAFT_131613 [Podospora aff. communis PSN243]|uniref:Uncharacterized protein n=1 Tax=Podospora aff. communis PSN243 TaxID=3040156 RepID=A0AAV9GLQ7_9PEZI|nr:hypothetical protein QBC34DRAFT_131613 [Podospora aff. communis PSN243]
MRENTPAALKTVIPPYLAMATSVPLSFKPQVPVTPPPDQHLFMQAPFAPRPQPPTSDFARAAYEATGTRPPQEARKMAPPRLDAQPTPSSMSVPPLSGDEAAKNLNNTLRDPSVDPRYLAMASRIASYYQQRCQAVANFQQQRCQQWANAQRQKCQEMMQASMLIVAWYIRDRISRRRKRQRRAFKRGLKQKAKLGPRNRITKGESVRRWVLDVPLGAAASPKPDSSHEKRFLDKEEEAFEMDRDDNTPDKDTQLFNVADGMIKSQLARIDVPLLGVLSFDESDSESESESEEEEEEEEEDQDNFEQAGGEDMDECDEDGELDEVEEVVEVADSKSVHIGTSTNRRTRSSNIS